MSYKCCDRFHMPSCKRCRKRAKVRVHYRLHEDEETYIVLRCWEHYLELENRLRKSTDTRIVRAEIL